MERTNTRGLRRFFTPRNLVRAWMLGFLGSLIVQTVFQAWFAHNSNWGASAGWQNEIAIWNLGVLILLGGVLRANRGVEAWVLPGLAVLSACFCTNHALALVSAPESASNWAGAGMNFLAVAMYGAYLLSRPR
ncbi:MAG: hypothetical protein H6699_07695 [Myxococcales bacterium]|nr:hypothetical protein [Myxococcales bacterium]